MKEFDLEKALAGAKVVTRDGREVTQLHKFRLNNKKEVIVGVVDAAEPFINPITFDLNGCLLMAYGRESPVDLFMAPVKCTGWINIYPGRTAGFIFETEKEAREITDKEATATIKIEWEE